MGSGRDIRERKAETEAAKAAKVAAKAAKRAVRLATKAARADCVASDQVGEVVVPDAISVVPAGVVSEPASV
jgi:hypothetical protein